MRTVRIVLLAVLCAAGTVVLGWWWLLIVGLLRGLAPLPRRGGALEAAAAGVLGWATLLAWSAVQGPVWRLAGEVAPIFGAPGWALLVVTLVFAGLGAGAAAGLAGQR
jgi:hypothetical protein